MVLPMRISAALAPWSYFCAAAGLAIRLASASKIVVVKAMRRAFIKTSMRQRISMVSAVHRLQPLRGLWRAEFLGSLVPGSSHGDIGREALLTPSLEGVRIVSLGERESRGRIARLGGALEERTRGREVALGDELLAAVDERRDLAGIEPALGLRWRDRLGRRPFKPHGLA